MPRCYPSKKSLNIGVAKATTTTSIGRALDTKRPADKRIGGEWKTPGVQHHHLSYTAQQQIKEDTTGPGSPTEASVAPIYYNGTHEIKAGKLTSTFLV